MAVRNFNFLTRLTAAVFIKIQPRARATATTTLRGSMDVLMQACYNVAQDMMQKDRRTSVGSELKKRSLTLNMLSNYHLGGFVFFIVCLGRYIHR